MKHEFKCSVCGADKVHDSDFTTGYGVDSNGDKVCFECCAIKDKESMRATGKATLYLEIVNNGLSNYSKVTNWPGTLVFDHLEYARGKHNIAGKRYDVWFTFERALWHGVTYGDNTQICHCRRTKHA